MAALCLCLCRTPTALAITYDSLTTEYFESIDDYGQATATDSIGLRFGGTLGESVRFDRSIDRFVLSNDLDVRGTLSGSAITVMGSATVARGNIVISDSGSTVFNEGGENVDFRIKGESDDALVMVDASSDKVGIGTANPTQRFHLKNGGTGEKFRIETYQSPYSIYAGGDFNGLADEASITFGATLMTHTADTTSTAWAIEASGVNDYFSIDRGINNGQGNPATFEQLLRIDGDGDVGIGMGSNDAKTKLEVAGVISGATLYATESFSGAGLTDCDAAGTSKLMWDATTGRFSCGTDQTGGSSGGLSLSDADARYVEKSGDTMTGALNLDRTSLNVIGSGTIVSHDPNDVVLVVKGTGANMTDLQQWKNSTDTVMANINYNGTFWTQDTINASYLVMRSNTSCDSLDTDMSGTIVCGSDNTGIQGYDVPMYETDPYYFSNPNGYINSSYDNIGYDTYFNITDGSMGETINTWDTIYFTDGTGIDVAVSGTDTVTISSNNTYANDMNQYVNTSSNVTFNSLNVSGNLSVAGTMIATPPSAQTISAGGTIADDACGTVKMISAASNVTTNTTNTFTAPSSSNAGCVMHVVNTGSTWIVTLDANAKFKTPSGVNVTLSPNYAVTVVSSGSVWYVMSSPSSNF